MTPVTVFSARPAHVPDELVRDFDFTDFPGVNSDPQLAWRKVQETYPEIFWTPHHGGHWVVTRSEDMKVMFEDYARFSNREPFFPIRPDALRLIPVQTDPPEHTALRRLIMPGFLPGALKGIEEKARALAVEFIAELAPKGECDFVEEFAEAMAITVFLEMMGLPQEDRPRLRKNLKYIQQVDKVDGFRQFADYMSAWLDKRSKEPGSDLVSRVACGEIDGRPLTQEEKISVGVLLLTGGLDTVVAMMSHIARYLAEHPERQQHLKAHPEAIPTALEEFIRREGVANMGRQLVDDIEYKGVSLKRGEQVMLPTALAGMDDRVNPCPEALDFDRDMPRHLAFGSGVHVCIGATLARREMRVFLEEWTKRVPEFRLDPSRPPDLHAGTVNTVNHLWLTWDPHAALALSEANSAESG